MNLIYIFGFYLLFAILVTSVREILLWIQSIYQQQLEATKRDKLVFVNTVDAAKALELWALCISLHLLQADANVNRDLQISGRIFSSQ